MTELTTSMLIDDAARAMIRLEQQARTERIYQYAAAYWTTAAWRQREVISEARSRRLRERWAEQRLARA